MMSEKAAGVGDWARDLMRCLADQHADIDLAMAIVMKVKAAKEGETYGIQVDEEIP